MFQGCTVLRSPMKLFVLRKLHCFCSILKTKSFNRFLLLLLQKMALNGKNMVPK